jgi:hypothetical protein
MSNLILEFDTQQEAQACLNAINALAAQWWQQQGYSVIDDAESPSGKRVVGKNAATREDDADQGGTTTWDIVKESPDGTFYFSSLSNKVEFYDPENDIDWKIALEGMGFTAIGTEKTMPEEWLESESI